MIKRMGRVTALIQLFLLSLTLLISSPAFSGEITITPGKFDHFNIYLPERIVAGENVSITLQAVDSLNNLITDFGKSGKDFQVTVSGSATVTPSTFKSAAFANGASSFTLNDKVVEAVTLTVHETDKPIPVLSKELAVYPNRLTSYDLTTVRSIVSAGEVMDIRITARDAFGNRATDQVSGRNLTITFKGDADPRLVNDSIPDLRDGSTSIAVSSEKTGSFITEVKDLITGSVGVSEKMEVVNGPAHSFKIFTPKEVIAGEPFEVSIVALDRFGNVATNYPLIGRGVEITSSGKLKPFPASVPAYEFAKGEAKVSLRYDAADEITLGVQEQDGTYKSTSAVVRIIAPIAERYEITTPGSAVAGQKFKIKITVFNQLNHVIKNYNIVGSDVELSATGSGSLVPAGIPASEFVNGTAVVEVQYNKSEAFSIVAVPVEKEAHVGVKPAVKPAVKKQAATAEGHPAAAQKTKKTKKTKEEGKKKAEAKNTKEPLELTGISLVEPKKKSTVSIHIPNLDAGIKYKAAMETVKGKKQIVLKLKSVVNKLDKDVKFDSIFIRKVSVEEDDTDKETTIVRIELVKPARFHVVREKNSLKVTLRH